MASTVEKIKTVATGETEKVRQLKADHVVVNENSGISTYFGVDQANTDSSLKAGIRGPTLLEDAHFREKIFRFDHERIPERVVHARGTAAHGYFKLHTSISDVTSAGVLTDTSRTTPVFLRFSTVAGSSGSADSVRDVRGFATRFYTEEGNWDIVGNNIPVFFIQDAIKFPDIIHAVKPDPQYQMPQAQSAHDSFWDFISLTPESTHMIMWHVSDRAIPRSYRMMQGFGVHSFLLTTKEGKRTFCKFHFIPKLGIHSLVWDEALKLAGQDPDFHRRDLTEAIDAGAYPEWDFGVQLVPEERENEFDFDLLDATKIIPEELVPLKIIGTLTLNRNVDEFFAETEQVAFCTQHMVPGIEHSNDPLLVGRSFSYLDTQLSRLGGPNFGDIPINRPIRCPIFNNARDGHMRRPITKGPNYWPNSTGKAPHPVPPEHGGYTHNPLPVSGHKTRARPEKFAEHFNQATLFYNSMSEVEKEHMVAALGFELGKVESREIQERVVNQLNQVDNHLASQVAAQLSFAPPAPVKQNHGKKTAFLSQVEGKHARFSPVGRKIGIYVLDNFDVAVVQGAKAAIVGAGSLAMIVGPRNGYVKSGSVELETQFSFETCRSTHFDAVFFAGGTGDAYKKGLRIGRLAHAAREAYMHKKVVAASGCATAWLRDVALPGEIEWARSISGGVTVQEGVIVSDESDSVAGEFVKAFLAESAKHRVWSRDVSGVAA